jgi:pimeloyl-ACP methyl ester carboxylesterase
MPDVTVNGVRLHYDEAGSGPPVVLIHAFPVGRRMWEPQMAPLATRHHVIAYDVRGFGLSEAPREPGCYSPGILVDDACALLEGLGAVPAAVCGLSMGGNIAVNLALAHPQAVSALIACDTGAGSEDPAAFAARCEEYAVAAQRGIDAFVEAAFNWSVFADYGAQGPAQAALLRELVRAQPPHGIALTARHALAPRKPIYALEAGLRALRVPTLVVYGERDEACVDSSRFLVSTIPGARLWMVPQASHFVNLDEPALFNETVLSFLQEHRADRRYAGPGPG